MRIRFCKWSGVAWALGVGALLTPAALVAEPAAMVALSSPGLVATITDGKARVAVVVANASFNLKDGESLHPQIGPAFTAHWTGSLRVVRRGEYGFVVESSDPAALTFTVDGKSAAGQKLNLAQGDHTVDIQFTRKPGPARLRVLWSSSEFGPEPLPGGALVHQGGGEGVWQSESAEHGRMMAEEMNCFACHNPSAGAAAKALIGRAGPDLSGVGARTNSFWIYKWLENPRHFREQSVMPTVPMSDDERRDVAAFLGGLKATTVRAVDQTPQAKGIAQGKELFASLGCAACHAVGAGGAQNLVSLDGVGSKWHHAQLAAYLKDPLSVDKSGRMPGMELKNEEAQALADYLLQAKSKEFEGYLPAGADPKHGEQVVRSQGCLNCHAIEVSRGKPLQVMADAGELAKPIAFDALDPSKGCLAEKPSGRAMDYHLDARQRQAIAAFAASVKAMPFVAAAPGHEFYRNTQKFRCVACHELDASKPADENEGVPMLSDVGGRLRRDWINAELAGNGRARPWFKRRMPQFGGGNVGTIPDQAVAASGAGAAEPLPNDVTKEQVVEGAKLMGNKAGGFACITCHSYGNTNAQVVDATRGPDITTIAQRLRADYFRRWVYDPKRIKPNTPMPSFFQDKPQAEADANINTLWRYVSLGTNMPPPQGFVDKENYTLVVGDVPVVTRTFMPGPTPQNLPRGIAVGLPGLLNYCFDAQSCQLRYAWFGGFLDMKASWSGRGGNVVRLLGKPFYRPTAFPIVVGKDQAAKTTDAQAQFKGYAFVNGFPQFEYVVDGCDVIERVTATEKGVGLVRNFEIDSHGEPVTFEAADEAGVVFSAAGGELQAAQLNVAGKTVAGKTLTITPAQGQKAKFSITVTSKEGK